MTTLSFPKIRSEISDSYLMPRLLRVRHRILLPHQPALAHLWPTPFRFRLLAFGFWLRVALASARCWPLVACTDACCRTKVGRSNPSQCAHQAPEREAARVGELARGLRSAGHADRLRREAREVRALSNPTASASSTNSCCHM